MKINTLKNGIKIVSDKIDWVDTVSLGIFIKNGSKNEKDGERGITHFIEHMLFKSNNQYNQQELMEELENRGAAVNGFTTKEFFCVHAKSLKEEIGGILDILYEMVFSPSIEEREVELEKKVILNEILRNKENQFATVNENLIKVIFKGHPLSEQIIGNWEDIQQFNHKQLKQYHKMIVESSDIVVSLTGNIDKQLLEKVRTKFQDVPRLNNGLLLESQSLTPNIGKEIYITQPNVHQHYLSIGFPTPTYDDSKLLSLIIYNHLLGAGRSSYLNKTFRESLGLAYSVGSTIYLYKEKGVLALSISTDIQNSIQDIKSQMLDLMQNDLARKINNHKIDIVKNKIKSNIVYSLENCSTRMLEFGKNVILKIDKTPNGFTHVDELMKRVDKVTAKDIIDLHEEIINYPPTISIIGKD